MANTRYIAPKALGSQSDTSWERKNYKITHAVGGFFGEGDTDSLYRGVFYGFPFKTEICGADGDISLYNTSLPSAEDVVILVDNGSDDDLDDLDDEEEQEVSPMPEEMARELITALLTHHQAQYDRWAREEEKEMAGLGW